MQEQKSILMNPLKYHENTKKLGLFLPILFFSPSLNCQLKYHENLTVHKGLVTSTSTMIKSPATRCLDP